ncbi:MAG: spermidine/putrescine transporter substrate-binding protein PotF [Rickettsiaceae bacterium]|jgi:putrescine transport system substrate-binding protein|nr:spermidine/putrescine transporter substrate-binding protein PotF [Rickettsiaceae bacterium]
MIPNLFKVTITTAAILTASVSHAADNKTPAAAEDKKLNIYNWSDYITPETISNFEKETGIKVQYDVYDSNQMLESKLMAGKTGYDIVVPTASPYMTRQIKLNILQKLDKAKLSNYKNLDPVIMKRLEAQDPGNSYGLPWMWGTVGIGYNVKKIKEIAPDAQTDSLSIIFDPKNAEKFKACGIVMLDSPIDIIPNALVYAGIDPNSQKPEDLEKAKSVMMAIRPFIRQFHSSKYIDDLANGDICLVLGYSGDIIQASNRAAEAKNGVEVGYNIPKEGAQLWVDTMVIPADAKHPDNAHKFLDYILKPDVISANTNFIGYANANKPALPLIKDEIKNNKQVYPSEEAMNKMYTVAQAPQSFERLRTRAWTSILSGH